MNYCWKITEDFIATKGAKEGTNDNAKGMIGPSEADESLLESPFRRKFRMYDDDNELYYEGIIAGNDDFSGFEPLDDFGIPNAGCTRIDYQEGSIFQEGGIWLQL